ncbi:branched-chain amino acid ABC transporter permease [Halopenitus sp. POP-27]|uniref:branched-chain amino acid ABC transporter permease n=1 Tax=Halopenitus sp. POP-27 TaxID=2994425 RepID=UPI00246905D6|nr:branched-chain amino acid ABC transporter permease [Halopenitus sp. POP-27]
MTSLPLPRTERTWTGVMAVVLALAPLFVLESTTYLRLYNQFLIFALLAIGLNIAFGHTDQLFLFMGALAGGAAYVMAVLSQDVLGISPWLLIPVGMAASGVLGALVSWVSAKRNLGVILISILTLNLQLALTEAYVGLRSITGGSTGYSFGGLGLDSIGSMLGVNRFAVLSYLLILFVVLAQLVYVRLIAGKYGLAFEAIREDDLAAASIGIDVVRYKTVAGFLAAALIGLGGIMMAEFQGTVLPGDYGFAAIDVMVLIMLIVGGIRTTFGPVVGAAVVFAIEELLSPVGQWETAIFGALLIVLFLYFREGMMPVVSDAVDRLRDGDEPPSAGTTDGHS